jgi:hypothetical protein
MPQGKPEMSELILQPDDPAFPETGLRRPSAFKMSKIMTIARSLVLRRLGKAPSNLQAGLDRCLKAALGLT